MAEQATAAVGQPLALADRNAGREGLVATRGHAKRDGEVCRPEGGGASAPFAHAGTLRQAFGAVTPLQRSWMENSTGLRP